MVRGQNKEEDESAPMPVKNAAGTTSDCVFQAHFRNEDETAPILIVGAGIVGLVLALAIDKHCGGAIKVELYEQAESFHDDVGAGMGMYPNGLRVIRDISPALLETIQEAGYPYLMRHYERHDGTEIASADELKLLQDGDSTEDTAEQLQPIGIRRWRLQKVLFQAVQDAGINVHFDKRLQSLAQEQVSEEPRVRLTFQDGTVRTTQLLIGCDGSKSQVRSIVSHGKYKLQHTGTTCLMGTSTVPSQVRGISLPSSETTKCHGAFYPTGKNEQCFQFHFPTIVDGKEMETDQHHPVDPKDVSWGGLTHAVEQEECNKLADRLIQDGWDEKFIKPLRQVDKALKIGFATLEPHLKSYICGHNNIVLVGDSAHPPVPYLGQGAQQGLEDAGTLALLLKQYCVRQQVPGTSSAPEFSLARVDPALQLYDKLRLPRTAEVLKRGKLWGKQQQKRAENKRYNQMREENIRRDVFYHETLPVLLPAVQHDYREEVLAAIAERDAKKHEAKGAARLVQPATSGNGSSNGGSVETAPEHHPLVSVPEETVCY